MDPIYEAELEAMYAAWVDSDGHLFETAHYGFERAAFYGGVAAERERQATAS